jgi:multidrug efflux pump subunit AcrB
VEELGVAERVIMRDGVIFLTIDAVAREAKLSKGGMLYHFATRVALGPIIDGLRVIRDGLKEALVATGNQQPGLVGLFTPFSANTPQRYADVDRTKAKKLNVPLNNLFDTLQVYMGSAYVNDFNLFGRTSRVTAQAAGTFRTDPEEISLFKMRSANGAIVPLGSLVDIRHTTGPDRVLRYNMFPAAEINGDTAPGYGSGQAVATMDGWSASLPRSGRKEGASWSTS